MYLISVKMKVKILFLRLDDLILRLGFYPCHSLFPLRNSAFPLLRIVLRFFMFAWPWLGFSKSSFGHFSISLHSQHPSNFAFMQQALILQLAVPPPALHPCWQRNLIMAPSAL